MTERLLRSFVTSVHNSGVTIYCDAELQSETETEYEIHGLRVMI
jgi:hypothetical protein